MEILRGNFKAESDNDVKVLYFEVFCAGKFGKFKQEFFVYFFGYF